MTNAELIESLRIRANIRRNATSRKSVQEGKPDRLANLLDLAAERLEQAGVVQVGAVEAAADGWPWKRLSYTNERVLAEASVGTPVYVMVSPLDTKD